MILEPAEIMSLVAHMRRVGVAEIELEEAGSALRVVVPEQAIAPAVDGTAAATTVAAPYVIAAEACGFFQPGHPARAAAPARGRRVEAGEVVGTIAAGPLLRPVAAPAAGTLGRLLCAAGGRVDHGTPLFEFAPHSPSSPDSGKRKDTR
ncbi:MAG: hypothetical protein JSR90_00250 [Proteobacteria bacterium]|nr:hypothetical protein [Pseudomonadota bacterium]